MVWLETITLSQVANLVLRFALNWRSFLKSYWIIEKALEQIINYIWIRLNVIMAQSPSDRIINKVRILADKAIPSGFLPF